MDEILKKIMDRDVNSILELLDIKSGKTTELLRFDYLIEAPFFHSSDELFFNSRGRIFSFQISTKSILQIDTGYCIQCNNDHIFSPDGTKLAVSHHSDGPLSSKIFIIDLLKPHEPFLVTPLAPSFLHG